MSTKKYREYDIDREELNELYWFCRQYSKKKTLAKLGNSKCEKECKLIEDTAKSVSTENTYRFLMANITLSAMPYEKLGNVPMGRQQFYEMRRRFFYELSKNK